MINPNKHKIPSITPIATPSIDTKPTQINATIISTTTVVKIKVIEDIVKLPMQLQSQEIHLINNL